MIPAHTSQPVVAAGKRRIVIGQRSACTIAGLTWKCIVEGG